jgi:hypothetical protein
MNVKIQCGCGAKYSLAVEREQIDSGVQLVCQECGADNSEMLRQVFAQQMVAAPTVVPVGRLLTTTATTVSTSVSEPETVQCRKHPGNFQTAECAVCGKPLCPKCLEQLGYFCSAFCKGKAEQAQIAVPEYVGQSVVVERQFWRGVRKGAWVVGAVGALIAAAWAWYAFIGSHPRVAWSEKMPRAEAGWCKIVAPGELLVWHGKRLARYDLAKRRSVWSTTIAPMEAPRSEWAEPDAPLSSRNVHWIAGFIWTVLPDSVAQIDWATGKAIKSIPVADQIERVESSERALFLVTRDDLGRQTATRIDGRTGETREERLPLAGELLETARKELVNARENFVSFSVKLVEARFAKAGAAQAERKGKSVLESGVTGANAGEAIAEIVGEWQQEEPGLVRGEDESRYSVTLRRVLADASSDWTGEVIGPPELYSLPTVDVLAAGKTIRVFDKSNKKLWEAGLGFSTAQATAIQRDHFSETAGVMPAVEHGNRLYFIDPGMLTCFELATGNALWRYQAGGISGLQFDREGTVYVSAISGGVEHLITSRSDDPEKRLQPVILKLDPANGKSLWDLPRRAQSCRASGKFIYAMDASMGEPGTLVRRPTPEHMKLYRLENETGLVRWEHYDKRMPLSWDCQANTIVFLFRNELQIVKFLSL